MALTDNLIANITFNNDWEDKSGNGNNITPSGIVFDAVDPKLGSHSAFGDGIDDVGEMADSPSLDSDYITVAVWFKTTHTGSNRFLIERSDGTYGANNWHFIQDVSDLIRFDIHIGGSSRIITSNTAYNDGNWHLVVATYDGSFGRIFVDNVYKGELAAAHGAIGASTDPITFFGRKGPSSEFPGNLDSYIHWGRALSFGGVSVGQQATGELAEIWNDGNGTELSTEDGGSIFFFNPTTYD